MGTRLKNPDGTDFYSHECHNCGWQGMIEDCDSVLVDPRGRHNPAEYADKCPDCGMLNMIEEAEMCLGCKGFNKYNDGDDEYEHCYDCLIDRAEAMAQSYR